MKNRRWRFYALGALPLDLIFLASVAVAYRYWPQLLIDVRFAMFSSPVNDRDTFQQSPEQMSAHGFLTDDEATRQAWREKLKAEMPDFAALPEGFASWTNEKKAEYLAGLFSRDGCATTFPETTTLIEKMQQIRESLGLCSDHVEVFLALCNIYGVPATEVSITNHTIARVWSAAQQEWVYIDPQYCLMARGDDGGYLSISAMRSLYYRGKPAAVHFEFFGRPTQRFAHADPHQFEYYDEPADFSEVILTNGNNVLEVDKYRADLLWLPKPVRQLFYLATGVMPRYEMLLDDRSTYAWRIERLRIVTYSIGAVLLVVNAVALIFLSVAALRRSRRPGPAAIAEAEAAAPPESVGKLHS